MAYATRGRRDVLRWCGPSRKRARPGVRREGSAGGAQARRPRGTSPADRALPAARAAAGRAATATRGSPSTTSSRWPASGLIKAIDRFEPGVGAFARYAVPTIVGELKRHFRDKGWGMHVPRYLQERVMDVNNAVEVLATELGRSPTPRDVAKRTGLSLEDVLEAMDAAGAYSPMSLDSPQPGAERRRRQHAGPAHRRRGLRLRPGRVEAGRGPGAWPPSPSASGRSCGCGSWRTSPSPQIAKQVGVSQMHVSRLLRRSLDKVAAAAEQETRRHLAPRAGSGRCVGSCRVEQHIELVVFGLLVAVAGLAVVARLVAHPLPHPAGARRAGVRLHPGRAGRGARAGPGPAALPAARCSTPRPSSPTCASCGPTLARSACWRSGW